MPLRQCLTCGMTISVSQFNFKSENPAQYCPKCDGNLLNQTDGSCLSEDIAHNRETIDQALSKLDNLLDSAYRGYYQEIQVIVGGSQIKDETLRQLYYYQQEGHILSFSEKSRNRGAILIQIRKASL